ncbi:hypothetical protein Tco_1287725, partial [Tanacetum coccineum]
VKERVEAKLDRVGTKFTWSGGQGFCLVYKDGDKVVWRSWSYLRCLRCLGGDKVLKVASKVVSYGGVRVVAWLIHH